MLQTSAALESILADVDPPIPPVPVWTAAQQQQAAAFTAANWAESPTVYYRPSLYQELASLYTKLQAAMLASAPQPVEAKRGVSCCLLSSLHFLPLEAV